MFKTLSFIGEDSFDKYLIKQQISPTHFVYMLENEYKNGYTHFILTLTNNFDYIMLDICIILKKIYPDLQLTIATTDYNEYKMRKTNPTNNINYVFVDNEKNFVYNKSFLLSKYLIDNSNKVYYFIDQNKYKIEILNYISENDKEVFVIQKTLN